MMEFGERRKCPQSSAAYRVSLSTKLQEIFMSDSPSLSYANFRHQFTRNVDSCKSSGIPQSSAVEGEAEEDEQSLNIGALDLRHLENWKCNNGSTPHMSSDYSSTKKTSYSSTELSTSYNSSIGQSSSPAWRRMDSSLLNSPLEASPIKAHFQANCYPARRYSYSPAVQRTYHLVPQSHHQKVFPCRSQSQNVSDTNSGTRKSKTQDSDFAAASTKSKMRVRESEMKHTIQSRTLIQERHPDCSKQRNKVVLLFPTDSPTNRGFTQSSDSAVSANLMLRDCSGRKSASTTSTKGSRHKEPHGSSRFSDALSCTQHFQDDSKRTSEMRDSYSTSMLKVKVPTQQLESPARSMKPLGRKSIMVPSKSHLSEELDGKTGTESSGRARQSSPIRRLSSAMGSFIRRSAASRDNSPVRRSISKDVVVDKAAADLTSSETDKSPASCRARSSPLRRFLLDPLIKPRPSNAARDSVEAPRKDFSLKTRHRNSSDQQLELVKAKSVNAASAKESSPVHALLQVAVKNGLPLFTLAVDNDNSILAATMRKLSTAEKNGSGWIYTFFTVHTMKKKKNPLWVNQGGKGKGHYVPNVIAQMKVADIRAPGRTRKKLTNCDSVREFSLFSVDVDQVDQNSTEFQPTDELAAIVVKLPKPTVWVSQDPNSSNHLQDCRESLIPSNTTTLILPGGVHTLPIEGSISTLTQRWRSGGTCDCGGWDLGCQLRIFTDLAESHKPLKTLKNSDEFKLFSQAGQESPVGLSLKPFKEKIYSVEFDPSISLVQAFATCVAFLDCKRPSGLFSMNNLSQGRSSGDPARVKPRDQSLTEAPATGSYVSHPPHSSVERV